MPSSIDQRKHPRLALSVSVDFKSEHNFYAGRARNISMGGLFVETSAGLKIGAQVDVDLRLLNKRVVVPCEVAWVLDGLEGESAGIGLRFLHINDATEKTIRAFMALRPPMQLECEDDEVQQSTA